ncbi:AIPR protein [compost metagenome]
MHFVDTMAFASEVAERLEEDPVFGEFVQVEYSGQGSRNRQLRLHGFTGLDESDGTLGLVVGRWSDSNDIETLLTADVDQLSGWVENFAIEALDGGLDERIAEASPAYEIATLLRSQRSKISRIRLHIFSNQNLSQRYRKETCGNVAGIPSERHIWDLQRLKALYGSSREREAVEISLADFGSDGIPCIEASRTDTLKSFLCVVDGNLLADLFERYGSRLLEGNVRSFLGIKGGVNKGIRATIQDSPALFFAYNNGIAATAASVSIDSTGGQKRITGVTDLQIVNGGQTTASILRARKQDHLSLDGVTAQMKLTVVERDESHDLIPRIAQYANTQNKIAIADFFANHPFHRKIEEISRRLLVPAKTGVRVQSKWFYERSRGQYQNQRLYLTKTKKDAFDLEFPAKQLINKTELAKYDSTLFEKPFWVSLGAQKNFMKFASQFSPRNSEVNDSEFWTKISQNYGEAYYQRIVAVAILWKRTEEIVSGGKGSWYEGDYRPQIVAYSLALLFHSIRKEGKEPELLRVWANQGIDNSFEKAVRDIAINVQNVLLSPPVGSSHVGEWCKKEACWELVKKINPNIPSILDDWSVEKEESRHQIIEERKQGAQDEGIAAQQKIVELAAKGYWQTLLQWEYAQKFISDPERTLLLRAATLQGVMKISTEREWRRLLEVQAKCEDAGFRFTPSRLNKY